MAESRENAVDEQERRNRFKSAFPAPVHELSREEVTFLQRNVWRNLGKGNAGILKHHGLVVYRCGSKRSNGAVRGCFLGAVLNLKGDKYWIRSQTASPGTISSSEIKNSIEAGTQDWGDYTQDIVEWALVDGDIYDVDINSIGDASRLGMLDAYRQHLVMSPAAYWDANGVYSFCGVSCVHTEAWIDWERALDDMHKVKSKRNNAIYLTGTLDSELG